MPRATRSRGAGAPRHWAEAAARERLEALGYRTVAVNAVVRGGEIDLVMRDGGAWVFVEVRQRRDERFGHPAETISPAKLRRMRRAATRWLLTNVGTDRADARLDAVLLIGGRGGYRLEHLRGVG